MSYFMSDEEPLGLPPMLPSLMTSELSPTGDSVNVLDMINQDVMLGNNYQSTMRSASTEVTYVSQYAASSATQFCSAAPYTSAGDVFLPSMPVTTAANTFVKPLHTYVPPAGRIMRTILKPNPRPAYRPANLTPENPNLAFRPANLTPENPNLAFRLANPRPVYRSSPNPIVVNPIVPTLTPIARKPLTFTETTSSKSDKSRKSSKKSSSSSSKKSSSSSSKKSSSSSSKKSSSSSSKKSSSSSSKKSSSSSSKKSSSSSSKKSDSRSHSSHKSSSHSKSSKKSSRDPRESKSKAESILSISSPRQSAFVPTSTRSLVRSTAVTHTVTRAANTVTESVVTLATETVTYATPTVAHTLSQRAAANAWSALRTATVTSYTATRTQSPVTGAKGTYDSFLRSGSSTTSTRTSYTGTKPRMPATIISPMQRTYLPTSLLYPGPTIISRTQPAATVARPTQTTYVIPASASTGADATPRFRPRFMIPATNTCTTATGSIGTTTASATTKHRVARQYERTTQSAHVVTNMQTYVTLTTTATTAAAASHTLTQSTFALPPRATSYAAKKQHSVGTTRGTTLSRTASTTEPQTFTILDGKGSFTTLTISSDFTTTTRSPLIVAHTQSSTAVTAGVGVRTSPITSETMIVPQNRFLIPIANSQLSPSTSLGYLVTSPIGSNIITTRNSAVASPQNATTTATGSHTLTTISSKAFNRMGGRLLCNVPSTGARLGSQSPSTIPADRNRGPVTIIANHVISAVNQRDGSGTLSTAASNATTPTRALFTAAPTKGLFAFAAPVITHSSSATADTASRPINRMVVMSNVHVPSNNQSSVSTQGTYILTTGIGSSALTTNSSRAVSTWHTPSTNTTTVTSTTVATTFTRSLSGDASGSAYSSWMDTSEVHSKLRSRLTVPVTSTEGSMPGTSTPVTTYTYSRSRPSHSVYAVPAAPIANTSSTKTSNATTLSPATMTLITFSPPTSADVPTTINTHRLRSPRAVPVDPPTPTTLSSVMTATPTLTNTGNRCVIKLATTSSGGNVSSVTTAVTTPITTAALSPPEHKFLEPHPMPSRLRTFPGPRTYPVAHRLAAGNAQRPPARYPNPRPKKVISNPAPLQIFADVVCPRTTTQSPTPTTATQGYSRSRFTPSQNSGNSTVVVPQYKNVDFKNLSAGAYPNPERTSSRLLTPRTSSDRLVLNRSLAFVSPRHTAPGAQTVAQSTPTTSTITQRTPRLVRTTHLETRTQAVSDTSSGSKSALTSTSKNPWFSPDDLESQ